MTSEIFYLHREKTNFIRVDSEDNWTKILVYKNDEKLGEIDSKENLLFGKPFQTSDGEIVFIRLKSPIFGKARIVVLINGDPYYYKKHSKTPIDRIKQIYTDFFLIAIASLLLGFLSIALNNSDVSRIDFGYQSVIFGIIYLCLGFAFKKIQSWTILTTLLSFVILDIILLLSFNFELDNLSALHNGLILRAYSLYLAITAFVLYRQTKKTINNVR